MYCVYIYAKKKSPGLHVIFLSKILFHSEIHFTEIKAIFIHSTDYNTTSCIVMSAITKYNAKKIERKLHLDVTEQRAVCQ